MALGVIQILGISVISLILVKLIRYYIDTREMYRIAAKHNGPTTYPIVGCLMLLLGHVNEIYKQVINWTLIYPSPIKVWVLSKLYFIVSDADQIRAILFSTKAIERDRYWEYLQPLIGTGLLTAPAEIWRTHRRMIMPTFNIKILQTFVKNFHEQSEVFAEQLRVHEGKGEFELYDYVSRCTLDVIGATAMGITINAQVNPDHVYAQAVRRYLELVASRAFTFYLNPDWIYHFTRDGAEHQECIKQMHGVTDEVIRKKRLGIASKDTSIEGVNGKPLKTLLDYMMELSEDGKYFTDEEVRDEVNTFLLAGNETTATTDCFAILMLASFPEVQQKAYDELRNIFGIHLHDKDLEMTLDDLNRMDYIERIAKETMRLFPVASFILRRVTSDLDIGGKILPKGCGIVLAFLQLHRMEKYWDKPLEFNPDRFLPEESAKRHPYCYVPFATGPRNCVGAKYAMLFMKTLLATIIRHYVLIKDEVVQVKDLELDVRVTLRTIKPITIRIERRIKTE